MIGRMSKKPQPHRGTRLLRLVAVLLVLVFLCLGTLLWMTSMPGTSYSGPLKPLPAHEIDLRDRLRAHVEKLAGEIGVRCVLRPEGLRDAAAYIKREFEEPGYAVSRQSFEADGVTCHNLEVEIVGKDRREEIVVIGGHYDTGYSNPGANDNGSGTAAVLELAHSFARTAPSRTLRFVAFVNEEPPYFQTELMGSRVYAKRCRERGENVVAMLSLETMGYYSDDAGSQEYPFPFSYFYPSTGNFVGFVGNLASRNLVRKVVGLFREQVEFPSEGGALAPWLTGVSWSDHWSFWQEGYPALMVTDTAPFRYPHYHSPQDTPAQIHYDTLARVVGGLESVVAELANGTRE
jgi:Zn-dependent M28 family amino/carboxypeptidase